MPQKPITVYTKTSCPPCRALKMFLNKKNIDYDEKNVEEHPHLVEEMIRKTGMLSVPQTVIGETVVSGPHFSRINELLA